MRRPLIPLALAFIAGLFLARALEPGYPAAALLLLGWLPVSLLAYRLLGDRPAARLAFHGNFVLLGLVLSAWHASAAHPGGIEHRLLPAAHPHADRRTPARLRGRLLSVPLRLPAVFHAPLDPAAGAAADDAPPPLARYLLEVESYHAGGAWLPATGRVELTVEGAPTKPLWPGDRVEVRAALALPRPATLPGGYDQAGMLARDDVRVAARATGATLLALREPAAGALGALAPGRLSARLRQRLAAGIAAVLPRREAGLLLALLLGHRGDLDAELRQRFRESGTAHLLAISGLHLALLAAFVWLLLGGLGLGSAPRARSLLVVLFVLGYALLAGRQPPVSRAAVMIAVFLLARLAWRRGETLNALAAAALLLLAWRPALLGDAGFQMSFVAVLFLAGLFPRLEAAWEQWRARPTDRIEARLAARPLPLSLARVRQSLFVSLAAWLGVAPLAGRVFGLLTPFAVLANLFAVPAAALVLLVGLPLGTLAALSPALAEPLAWPAWVATRLLEGTVALAARLPGATRAWEGLPGPLLALYYLGALAFFLWTAPRARPLLLAAFVALNLCLLPNLLPRDHTPPAATLFDLGRGQATLLEPAGGAAVLVDAGGSRAGDERLARALGRLGVRRLDALLVTRDAPEHYAGLAAVLERLAVGELVLPESPGDSAELAGLAELARARGVPVVRAHRGDRLRFRDAAEDALEFLAPPAPGSAAARRAGRSRPAALAARGPGGRWLFAHLDSFGALADLAEADAAAGSPGAPGGWLRPTAGWRLPRNAEEFLARLRPAGVVLGTSGPESGGAGTRELLDLGFRLGLPVLRTDLEGTLRLRLDATGRLVREGFWNGGWRELPENGG